MAEIKTVIGLMSGTSMDGIDAALLATDGRLRVQKYGCYALPYSSEFRQELHRGLAAAQGARSGAERPAPLPQLERQLTLYHAQAVKALLRRQNLAAEAVDFIGFHGQTLLHRPPLLPGARGFTLQLGNGALLARETGITTIADMRSADMRAGGSGAPLVPVYHRALAAGLQGKYAFPLAFVNIGGIANCTYVEQAAEESAEEESGAGLIAFDCGPGNCLIDAWAQKQKTGQFFDAGGEAGLRGAVDAAFVQAYCALPIFREKRRAYDLSDFPPPEQVADFPPEMHYDDGAASLAFITAARIIASFAALPHRPKTLIISGGGVRNQAVMRHLRALSGKRGAVVKTAESVGLDSDFMEAEAWGYLAARAQLRLPLTYPATTGCDKPVSGGVIYPKGGSGF